jgi:APA family basic amino acid/polyamine antiporter
MLAVPKKELSVFDSTCIIVGIIIGAGIYETAPTVAGSVNHWWAVPAIWLIGGFLSLAGALCYAELATAYPQEGGDYVYLSKAYGRWAGFLFAWLQLTIVRPGDIALMAFIFARYAQQLFGPAAQTADPHSLPTNLIYATVAVVILTFINILGVREGKWTQNLLTVVKVLGLMAILVAALATPHQSVDSPNVAALGSTPLSLAMILILFTFGGWNEVAYVAAEVKEPSRNILRALVFGMVGVILLYLIANSAFLYALGHGGMVGSKAVATDTIRAAFPKYGSRIIAAIICISTLGAINGLVFTGARISYALGVDHWAFRLLGKWDSRKGTPTWALAVQGVIAVALIVALRSFLDTILYTAAAVYSFYMATCLSVIVLRFKQPHIKRPYNLTGYPVTAIIFCAVCAFLIYSAVSYALHNKPISLIVSSSVFLTGVLVYRLTGKRGSKRKKAA